MELTIEQALQKGIAAHKEGNLQEAERLYQAILQSHPLHPDANHNLGIIAVSVNKAELALPLFKKALEANPKIEQFWLSYIDSLIKKNQFETARAVLEQGRKMGLAGDRVDSLERQLSVPAVNTENIESSFDELAPAIQFRDAGKFREAQEWLQKFIESKPNHAEAFSLLCHVLLLYKKDAEAERALLTAASINSELASIYRNQARLLLRQSKPEGALKQAQIGYERSVNNPESCLILATCLNANQRSQEALDLTEQILLSNPNYAEALATRAFIRLQSSDNIGAIADAGMAVSLKPHLTQVWGLLSSLHYKNKNLSGAITAAKKAHELEPTNVNYMKDLAGFFREEYRVLEAIIILEMATKLAPKNTDVLASLGMAFQANKDIDKAKAAYEKALAINPKLAEVLNNLGSIAQNSGDWNAALQCFEGALKIKPDIAEFHYNLGLVLKGLRKLEEAEASYRQAVLLKPDYALARFNLAMHLFKEKQYKKAAEQFKLVDIHQSKSFVLSSNPLEEKTISSMIQQSKTHEVHCSYLIDEETIFYEKLDFLIGQGEVSAVIGSLTSRSDIRYGNKKQNPFCNDPLRYVVKTNLNEKYDFERIFIETAKDVLTDRSIPHKSGGDLTNGIQTVGNLFNVEKVLNSEIENIIHVEIEKYRIHFKDSEEGFIKNWPTAYNIYGWLVSMQSGGKVDSHMHESSWISGGIYINVPPKSKPNSGSLVLCLNDKQTDLGVAKGQESIIDVVTGSLCFFPSSLYHYTIPFEEEESRIMLAFDVIPIK